MSKYNALIKTMYSDSPEEKYQQEYDIPDPDRVAVLGFQERDRLSDTFFSSENILRIQKKIKKEIFDRTHGVFRLDADQEESDLLVVMMAIFKEYARFLPDHVIRQVKELNDRVVEYLIPDMITEIKQEYGYLREINAPLKPMDRPVNLNSGKQILPGFTTIFDF